MKRRMDVTDEENGCGVFAKKPGGVCKTACEKMSPRPSRLMQWPCQIALVPVNAPYFDGADLLIAADCAAYAYASFHDDFMKDHITLIGCSRSDVDKTREKLVAIFSNNQVKSVTVAQVEVPCCAELAYIVNQALHDSGKTIPKRTLTITTDGKILCDF